MQIKTEQLDKEADEVFKGSHVLVVLEDMRENIKLLAEGQVSLRQEMCQGFSDARKELDEFNVETRDNFKIVFEYLSRIDDELADIKSELKDLKKDLKTKADVTRFEKLEKRVFAIEQRQMLLADSPARNASSVYGAGVSGRRNDAGGGRKYRAK